jgi:hypothetical protein
MIPRWVKKHQLVDILFCQVMSITFAMAYDGSLNLLPLFQVKVILGDYDAIHVRRGDLLKNRKDRFGVERSLHAHLDRDTRPEFVLFFVLLLFNQDHWHVLAVAFDVHHNSMRN